MDGGKHTTIKIHSHTIKIPTFILNYQSDKGANISEQTNFPLISALAEVTHLLG